MPPSLVLPSSAREVIILTNPRAGAGRAMAAAERLCALLNQGDCNATVLCDLDEAAEAANRLHAAGTLRTLVGVGGDGTAAALVNRTEPGVPLLPYPAGNENLLARYLGLEPSPESCCRAIAAGRVVRWDAGRVGQRIFLLMLGCGFDAEVVRRFHGSRKGPISRLTYLRPIFQAIAGYRYPPLQLYWNTQAGGGAPSEQTYHVCPNKVRWAFVFNLPCYGGGLRIAPEADGGDGLLDLCTFHRGGLWHGLRYVAAVLAGRQRRLADFDLKRVARVRITADEEVPYQLDGDPAGVLPVEVEVLPQRLTLLVGDRGM
jgi:diacylglycerol kinase (ATP)